MSVKITYKYPQELIHNPTMRRTLYNVADFVRDLWLARAPYASGDYAQGLLKPGSVKVRTGEIIIENKSKHAWIVENGFSSYNLGLAMLRSGKGVKVSQDGNAYKVIKIEAKPTARYRKESVAGQVQKSFKKTFPIGMRSPRIDRFGIVKQYKPRQTLRKALKPGKARQGGPQGIFVVSQKAIAEDPSKWKMPARTGKHIAKDVQKEGKEFIVQALREAMKEEKARQQRLMGKTPKWYRPHLARTIGKTIPPKRSGER